MILHEVYSSEDLTSLFKSSKLFGLTIDLIFVDDAQMNYFNFKGESSAIVIKLRRSERMRGPGVTGEIYRSNKL